MGWTLAWIWLTLYLLFLMFIIIGSVRANTYRPRTIVLKGLWRVGAVCVLLCIILLAVKTYLLIMQFTIAQTMQFC